jgi:hypothetical protein
MPTFMTEETHGTALYGLCGTAHVPVKMIVTRPSFCRSIDLVESRRLVAQVAADLGDQ